MAAKVNADAVAATAASAAAAVTAAATVSNALTGMLPLLLLVSDWVQDVLLLIIIIN